MLEEKNRSLEAMQATHELQIKQLRVELEKERDKLANLQLKLQGTFLQFENLIVMVYYLSS